jgi:acyl carrier protein
MGQPASRAEMMTVDSAILHFAESLAETVRHGNVARFRDYLRGGLLPAVGGDATPAQLILQGLAVAPDYSATAKGSARLLAHVLLDEARHLESPGAALTVEHKYLLLDALGLAAALPAQAKLFQAIWRLRQSLIGSPDTRDEFLLPILDALVFQQSDGTLESLWLKYMDELAALDRAWKPLEQDILFVSWRGLLWIPPEGKSEVINFARVERGLRAISRAVVHQDDGPRLLRHALNVLSETYPRSAELWTARLTTRVSGWPPELQEEACRKWPGLRKVVPPAATAHARPALATPYVQPRTELERSIASVWAEVLEVDPVGVHDNFFELGGDSILGLELINRLREWLGIGLSEMSLYEAPTVAALARTVASQGPEEETATVKATVPVNSESRQSGERRKTRLLERRGAGE